MKYFAMIDGSRVGPMELPQLAEAGLRPDTYVWCKGMDDWRQAREVADVCRYFRNRLYDRLHPTPADELLPAPTIAPEQNPNYWQLRAQIHSQPEREDTGVPPSLCPLWLLLLAFMGFFPLAIIAYVCNRRAQDAWERHASGEAHDLARRAKMMAGIAVCLGVMTLATLLHLI